MLAIIVCGGRSFGDAKGLFAALIYGTSVS